MLGYDVGMLFYFYIFLFFPNYCSGNTQVMFFTRVLKQFLLSLFKHILL